MKHSFRTFRGNGQGSWVNVEVCGWNEAVYIDTKKEDGSDATICVLKDKANAIIVATDYDWV